MASQIEPKRGERRGGLTQAGQVNSPFENIFRDFEDFFTSNRGMLSPYTGETSMPLTFETRETNDSYVMAVDLPGVKKENIDIDISGDTLTIRGERHDEYHKTEGRSVYSERRYGSFERSFSLPTDSDPSRVEATYDDGVLHLMIPKAAESKRHKVTVKEGGGFIDKMKKAVGIDKGKIDTNRESENKAS